MMDTKTRTFDLHGYSTDTALMAAQNWVREAWEHGLDSVEFVHGSRTVTMPTLGSDPSVGSIKWAMRDSLRNGNFRPYAKLGRSGEHRLGADTITIALEQCPDPDPHGIWTAPPPIEF